MTDWTTSVAGEAQEGGNSWVKFAIGGVVIIAALVLLLYTSTQGNAQYFVTVDELGARETEMLGKDIRISGIVVPNSISYDATTLHLEFDIVDSAGSSQ